MKRGLTWIGVGVIAVGALAAAPRLARAQVPGQAEGEPAEAPAEEAAPPAEEAAPPPAEEAAPPPAEEAAPPAEPSAPVAATPTPPVAGPVDAAPGGDAVPAFRFGSYGRVHAATDLAGGTPQAVSIAAHPPRIVEESYVELELQHARRTGGWLLRTVITPAFAGEPFHYTGDFAETDLALRNLYAELGRDALSLWVGSRMVRGDDVYLLDWWPLDNLNLVGGGVSWRKDRLELRAHVGVNRLLDPFQNQVVGAADTFFGEEMIERLDRQRLVAATRAGVHLFGPADGAPGTAGAGVFYVEIQGLPAGQRERTDGSLEELPRDAGVVLGAELKLWGFGARQSHASLFLRYGAGLGAADWLSVPSAVGVDRTTWGAASELTFGVSGNLELGRAGLLLGGYARRFTSAAPDAATDYFSGDELVADARPWVRVFGPVDAAFDVSVQRRWPNGLSPSELTPVQPTVVQLAPMLLITPGGPGSYARPQLRLVYRAAHLDDDARSDLPEEDPMKHETWVHYLGLQAEWWFDSSYQ